ncbi:MAG: RibD family protein [Bacteroidota bacterium]
MLAKETFWRMLLALKQQLRMASVPIRFCVVDDHLNVAFNTIPPKASRNTFQVLIQLVPAATSAKADLVFIKTGDFQCELYYAAANIDPEGLQFFMHYLPYCFTSILAKLTQRAVTIAHFAQSLDGKIATPTGHSKWIGNPENLVHAHRMRALCDAILVGSGTLNADHPKLTVRHVEGENPIRVVLGTSAKDYTCLYQSCTKEIVVIGNRSLSLNGQIQYLQLEVDGKRIESQKILSNLYERGIHSVYIEGGPTTTSGFLNDQAIDVLQLHVAPIVLGAGIPSIKLPAIEKVSDAKTFRHFWYQPVGDAIMFTGIF